MLCGTLIATQFLTSCDAPAGDHWSKSRISRKVKLTIEVQGNIPVYIKVEYYNYWAWNLKGGRFYYRCE